MKKRKDRIGQKNATEDKTANLSMDTAGQFEPISRHASSARQGGQVSEITGSKHFRSSLLTDFYIDFLGSLVPGIFALFIGIAVLAWSGSVLCYSICPRPLQNNSSEKPSFGEQITKLKDIGLGTYGNIGLLLVSSYVLGSIFYRQDPKKPDHKSARRIWRRELSPEDRERLAVQPTTQQSEKVTEYDAQFPYFFLREYLEGRGLNHLVQWVPWSGKDKATWKYRTKMHINILKIRLQYLIPERCKDIIRNEAHVRMATSVWYATYYLIIITAVALIMAVIAAIKIDNNSVWDVIIFDSFIIIFAFFLKYKIEWFTHYLRVREVVYVLEMADFATKNGLDLHPADFIKRKKTTRDE